MHKSKLKSRLTLSTLTAKISDRLRTPRPNIHNMRV